MSRYTVVVTPEAEDAEADSGHAEATIKVETGGPNPRIIEMTIRSTAVGGLSARTLPSIDLEAVVAALVAGVHPAASAARPETQRPAMNVAETALTTADEPASAQRAPGPGLSVTPNATASSVSDRAYRRMPDAGDVRRVYEKIGTVTGLAQHYGVPRHTAQGWMSRLRKLDAETLPGSADAT
ncbi:hypothetical protein [Nocardia brasiliensis]|uniref:hypothetical protein n=1 Tax=Nocardia brasiliensis TaxID=37326 RepID=UPI0024590E4E|nr:hypothetical protein [Nocardia brasiliensis]